MFLSLSLSPCDSARESDVFHHPQGSHGEHRSLYTHGNSHGCAFSLCTRQMVCRWNPNRAFRRSASRGDRCWEARLQKPRLSSNWAWPLLMGTRKWSDSRSIHFIHSHWIWKNVSGPYEIPEPPSGLQVKQRPPVSRSPSRRRWLAREESSCSGCRYRHHLHWLWCLEVILLASDTARP